MPTTPLKNTLYRLALPFMAPSVGKHPVCSVTGHGLESVHDYEKLIRRHHILGSAALVASGRDDSVVCTFSEDPPRRAGPDTYFRVASITKTAVAVLAMRLADEGLIDPDAPVSGYFGTDSAADALEGITLRHLLSHTAGLQDPPGLESALENGKPFPDLLPAARLYEPGSSFHYSNLGFGIVGCVMEAVLDRPVGQIFRERLFTPLGMDSTGRIMPVTRILPYRKESSLILTVLGSKPLETPDPFRHYGHTAGSMYTDIRSLKKLLLVPAENRDHFLSDHAVRWMKSRQAAYGRISPTLSYGMGLLRISDPSVSGGLVLGHQGFAYGCVDGAFWEEDTGRICITLNGGCSEARIGRLGLANRDFLRWAFRKELPKW